MHEKYDMSIHTKLYVGYRSEVDDVLDKSYHISYILHTKWIKLETEALNL